MGKIRINGAEVPADITGGALLRFKREAGYDFIREPEKMDTEGLLILAWACAKSTAALNGDSFGETVESMADKMSLEELNALAEWLKEGTSSKDEDPDGESKKKTVSA